MLRDEGEVRGYEKVFRCSVGFRTEDRAGTVGFYYMVLLSIYLAVITKSKS